MIRSWLLLVLVACSTPPKTSRVTADDAPQRLDDIVVQVTNHLHRFDPANAVELGLHDFDGQLPDRSPAALDQIVAQLEQDRQALMHVEAVTDRQKAEREVLLQKVRSVLFQLVQLDAFRTNPMAYSDAINLDAYIIRDYAPLADRAGAIIKLCNGLPAYLSQARANLKLPMPRPWIDTALLQTRGLVEFADKDVRTQLTAVTVPLANQAQIEPALDTCKRALIEHAAWLEQHQANGTGAFALGKQRYLQMLADTQGVELDLARLEAIANADLQRNLTAIEAAAKAIDPKKPVRDVVLAQAEDKPAANQILELATQQAEAMRKFLVDKHIVTIPSTDVALVRESPPFQRWNAAFLDHPGPFETKSLPSYYYISPPDPKWPAAEQRAYIIPRNDLLFTTIHEVWPGHFLQFLHIKKHPSKVLQSFCTYSNSEGWAHYTEEMMFDAAAGNSTPQARIGMLKEALLRNVRFVVALGEHTGGMTVEQATKLFEDKAFVDPGNARQQAVRGTFDPMFLSYTLGKLMIRKLRDDWMQTHPGRTVEDFHDAFLSYACAPVPMIRRMMLGDNAGPVL
ncbi:MAG TPA: DUF885 domain-containing protein [Kofleriaceae bacterium]|nr:DUF885 domain-containing protein [Kofleriaceae bacterium]